MKVIQVNPKVTSWSTPGSANASGEIVDFGVNTAALVELSVPATACPLTLRMQFAEAIHENRTLYHHIVSVNKTKQHRNSSHLIHLNSILRFESVSRLVSRQRSAPSRVEQQRQTTTTAAVLMAG